MLILPTFFILFCFFFFLARFMAQGMLQCVLRRAAIQTSKPKSAVLSAINYRSSDTAASEAKFYGTIGVDEPHSKVVAQQMIQYALCHARSQKSGMFGSKITCFYSCFSLFSDPIHWN